MSRSARIIRVAVPCPLRRTFDYLPHPEQLAPPGVRVSVPFGTKTRVGIVLAHAATSELAPSRLKTLAEVLDDEPVLDPGLLRFLGWASDYCHHPIGEVVAAALPGPLRSAGTPKNGASPRSGVGGERVWRMAVEAVPVLPNSAHRQRAVVEALSAGPASAQQLAMVGGGWRAAVTALVARGWVRTEIREVPPREPCLGSGEAPELNCEQRAAVAAILEGGVGFRSYLLAGVTGSGKTEVYLAITHRIVAMGCQALVLVPEIGLTPQLVQRFRARFGDGVAVYHSGLGARERFDAWSRARLGTASVVIGTRSAVFLPLARPGIVIVDEEHDLSFKQQDGFRYSARDLSVVRAKEHNIPVVLGSATPSLETLLNVRRQRFQALRLPHRAGGAKPPLVEILDLRGRHLELGLSQELLKQLEQCLAKDEQALLFLNRRGYAPLMLCRSCGWVAQCTHCDAHLVAHLDGRLRCHHCGATRRPPACCPDCGQSQLHGHGAGTQRLVEFLRERFPHTRIERMDRDNTRGRRALSALLEAVRSGEIKILVGTQMVAKGHDFPGVTLVGVIDADAGLFGCDFRANERLGQLLVQVSGRAGRGERPGTVWVQTHHPNHPALRLLLESGYHAFAESALAERESAHLPPYTAMALLRAESNDPADNDRFLSEARELITPMAGLAVYGPVPAPMERRAGRYRSHLLLEAQRRPDLQLTLGAWLPVLDAHRVKRGLRWSLDVDPQELL